MIKALFRLFVLCFFLLHLGMGFTQEQAKARPYILHLEHTFVSKATAKIEREAVFCSIEVNIAQVTAMDKQDPRIPTIGLSDVFHFLLDAGFEFTWVNPLVKEQQDGMALQQHRPKYLLHQSFKIPHWLV